MSGEKIGGFRILSELGKGAQGRVFHAVCEQHAFLATGMEVALKVIPVPSDAVSPEKSVAAYASIIGRDVHPGVMRYYDAFLCEDVGRPQICLVMEFVKGEPFDLVIKKNSQGVAWNEARDWLLGALDALDALARAGRTHRDVKPGNLFLLNDGSVKWIDLDLSSELDAASSDEEERTRVWRGSLEYMAPDFVQVSGFAGDQQSDVFSFAVCAYEILTGLRPFGNLGERPDLAYTQRWREGNDTVPNLRTGQFRVMEGLSAAFSKALHQDRARRFADFASFRAALADVRPRVLVFPEENEEFELQALLGHGGFGEVYKAVRKRDGRIVAVKNLFSSQHSRRFVKEANILKEYAHPHIVRYEGLFSQETKGEGLEYFLVMEYLDGDSLHRRLKAAAPDGIPVEECLRMFSGYLDALHHLHTAPQPIIHRDIKPGNLHAPAGAPDEAKLLDLGVARDVGGTETFGHVPGTLAYMAPEFARPDGGRGTPQSDIYAMGFCLYEALAGETAAPRLPKDMDQSYIAFFKRSQRPLVLDFDKPVFRSHPGLMNVLARALAFDPKARYTSALDMRKDLERLLVPDDESVTMSFDDTLRNVIGPTLVIDKTYAEEHMADWDEAKFMPPKLPSEVLAAESRGGYWGWIAGLAAAVAAVAVGGLLYVRLNQPDAGLSAEWAQTLQDQSVAGREAATPVELQAVLDEVARLRGEPDAVRSEDMLAAIESVARRRAMEQMQGAFADVERAGAGDDERRLEQAVNILRAWSDLAAAAFKAPEGAELAARADGIVAAHRERRGAVQAFLARLADVDTPAALPAVWSEGRATLDREGLVLLDAPAHRPALESLRAAFLREMDGRLNRIEPADSRQERLAEAASLSELASRSGFLPETAAASLEAKVASQRGRFVLIAVNPHAMPLRLQSPVLPPDSTVPAGAEAVFSVPAMEEAALNLVVDAGAGYATTDIALPVMGGGASRWTVPMPARKPVAIRLALPALPGGTPEITAALESNPGEWKPLPGLEPFPEGRYNVRFSRDDYEPVLREATLVAGTDAVVSAPEHTEWKPGPALSRLAAVEATASLDDLRQAFGAGDAGGLAFPAHLARWEAQRQRLRDMLAARLPEEVAATYARLCDYFSWLVQLQEPIAMTRTPFRRSAPFADADRPLTIPVVPEGVELSDDTLARIELIAAFSPRWESTAKAVPRELSAVLVELARRWDAARPEWAALARDVAAALRATDPRAVPPKDAEATSWLREQWRAHASFNRDLATAGATLDSLATFGSKGGVANRMDFALAAAAAVLIWENAADSVRTGTAIGGTRHREESVLASNALRMMDQTLAAIPVEELQAGIDWIVARGTEGAWAGRHLTVLAALTRMRLPAAAAVGVAAILARERAAFETRSHPDAIRASQSRTANLNYLLLDY